MYYLCSLIFVIVLRFSLCYAILLSYYIIKAWLFAFCFSFLFCFFISICQSNIHWYCMSDHCTLNIHHCSQLVFAFHVADCDQLLRIRGYVYSVKFVGCRSKISFNALYFQYNEKSLLSMKDHMFIVIKIISFCSSHLFCQKIIIWW